MSVAVAQYETADLAWGQMPSFHEEEHEWLPNPYQAQADAQVLAGAWPGTPLLMGCVQEPDAWGPLGWDFEGMPCQPDGALGLEGDELSARQLVMHSEAGNEAMCWDASPWNFLCEFHTPEEEKPHRTGSMSTVDVSTDEGDVDADPAESSGTAGEASPTEAEGVEIDDTTSTVGVTSERSGRFARKLSHQCVPKKTDFGKKFGEEKGRSFQDIEKENITTLMVRNIPNMYTRSMLMEELDSVGFEGEYDFIYLPMDKSTQWNVGYAFVNFITPSVAVRVVKELTNYAFQCYEHGSGKVAQISIAHIQGLERNLEYYSNTAVQCARIQTYRPLALTSKQDTPEPGPQRAHRRRRRMRSAAEHASQGQHRSTEATRRSAGSWSHLR
mmetsp:Transcript_1500/g.3257  ORF Transcript_1500/g.3257 Transcript_1500/m.3257 type:complete len:385 (-) Transcript_1500:320-1474(-)